MSAGTSVTVSIGWKENGKREGATAVASLMGRCTYSQHTLFVLVLATRDCRLKCWRPSGMAWHSSSTDTAVMVFVTVQPQASTASWLTAAIATALVSCQPQQQQGMLGSMHAYVCMQGRGTGWLTRSTARQDMLANDTTSRCSWRNTLEASTCCSGSPSGSNGSFNHGRAPTGREAVYVLSQPTRL